MSSPAAQVASASDARARVRAWLGELRVPFIWACVAFAVLAFFAGDRFWHQSKAPQFVYQAVAFLHGKLELLVPPPNIEDWVLMNGKWYSSFPAFPALLMVPFVALNGYQLNDTSFTVILAALNLLLFFLVLRAFSRSGDSTRTERENLILCGLLGFGTLYFYCSIRGEVWFTAEVMGVGLTALYVLFAHRARNPLLAGLFYAAGTLTRTPIMFAAVFFLCEVFAPNGSLADLTAKLDANARRAQLKKLALFVAGALPLAAWHAYINYARFGSPGDFGHDHLYNNRVNADIARWGLFNAHYLARNVVAAFLLLPKVITAPKFELGYNPHGLSLLLTTPLFALALFPAVGKGKADRFKLALGIAVAAIVVPWLFDKGPDPRSPYLAPEFGSTALAIFALFAGRLAYMGYETRAADPDRPRLQLALVLTIAAMAVPGFFYQNDGYMQFGFRFSLDWTPFMFLLLAVGRRKMDRLWWALASVGLAVNTWGAVAFKGYSDLFR